jgi:hypothetical protein
MYLRLVRFTLSETGRSKSRDMADDLVAAIKQQPGCVSTVFFGDEDGEAGLCVIWQTQEQADAAAAVIGPKLEQHLTGNVTGDVERRLFPILAN